MLRVKRNARIIARDGKLIGKATGGGYGCRMEGCRGWRIGVRWRDGSVTFPCSKGMLLLWEKEAYTFGRIL